MAQEQVNKKARQLSLEEYGKIKEKRAKNRLKLQFPMVVKFFISFPIAYLGFLILFFLFFVRFATKH